MGENVNPGSGAMGKVMRVRHVVWGMIVLWGLGHGGDLVSFRAHAQVAGHEEIKLPSGQMPAWMQPSPYRYDPLIATDPFVPFIRKEEPPALQAEDAPPSRPRTPQEKIDVTQLTAVGIVWYPQGSKQQSMAMVQLPDGKGFIVHKGMRVGRHNGIVEAITPEAIIVREQGRDILGKRTSREVLIKLHRKQGAQHD
jgi:type IV pilus assembly protein PilP